MLRIFRKYDPKDNSGMITGVRETDFAHAEMYNKKGFGIFFTPNPCEGRLLKENVTSINWWFIDTDDGEKTDILQKIRTCPLYPSVIIETKRGYHAYWRAKDGTKEKFRTIAQGLIDYFNSDNAVKNPNRLMRVAGYYNMKDPNEPYKVHIIEQNNNAYTENMMLLAFVPLKANRHHKKVRVNFDKVVNTENEKAILKEFCKSKNLSGFNENSGRRNYLLHIIGIIKKYYRLDYIDRCKIIHTINRNFACPLDVEEVETVLRTTVEGKG